MQDNFEQISTQRTLALYWFPYFTWMLYSDFPFRVHKPMIQVTILQLEKTYGRSKEAKAFIQSITGGALDFFV